MQRSDRRDIQARDYHTRAPQRSKSVEGATSFNQAFERKSFDLGGRPTDSTSGLYREAVVSACMLVLLMFCPSDPDTYTSVSQCYPRQCGSACTPGGSTRSARSNVQQSLSDAFASDVRSQDALFSKIDDCFGIKRAGCQGNLLRSIFLFCFVI